MRLYHGSNVAVRQIELHMSKPNKDFGKGFYLSDTIQQANDKALFKSMQLSGEPVVSEFEFDTSVMDGHVLRVKIFHDYSEEWADFVFIQAEGNPVEAAVA